MHSLFAYLMIFYLNISMRILVIGKIKHDLKCSYKTFLCYLCQQSTYYHKVLFSFHEIFQNIGYKARKVFSKEKGWDIRITKYT